MDKYLNHTNEEEPDGLGVDVQGDGDVSDGTNTIQYRYREIHVSKSKRGISLTITSQRGGIQVTPRNHQYDISPNPHEDPYYDGHERNFYAILAKQAMEEVLQQQDWLHRITIRNRHFSEDYILD